MPHDRDRVGLVERANANDLERARNSRPFREEKLGCCRSDLGDERDRPGLDVRKERVEQALRTARVLAREQRLLELGQHAHHVLTGERVDEGLDAAFELADERSSCVDLRGRRLEDGGLGFQPIQRCPRECRLPDTVLAHQQNGTRRRLLERRDDDLDELAPPTGEKRGRAVERSLPHSPDTGEIPECPPFFEALSKLRPELVVEAVDERLDLLHPVVGHAVEGRGIDDLAALRSVANELRDQLVANRAQRREHGPDHGCRRVDRQRTQ